MAVDRRRFAQRQHRALALHLQLRLQGVGQQAYVAQGMAQAGAEGIAGEEQVFQEQAVERRQVLGQVQADMLFAALVGSGLPEQVLCGMGKRPAGRPPGGSPTRTRTRSGSQPLARRASITGRISATSSVRSRMVFF